MPLATAMGNNPRAILGQVAGRFRCNRCGSRPSALVLIDDLEPSLSQDDSETTEAVQMAAGRLGLTGRDHVGSGTARCVSVRQEREGG